MFLPLFDYLERPLLRKNCCKNRLKNVAIQIFAPPFFLQRGKQKHSFLVDNNANFAKYSNPMMEEEEEDKEEEEEEEDEDDEE